MSDVPMKLTRDILDLQPCFFAAKTEEEARLIQLNLLALGCRWRESGFKVANLDRVLREGIWVEKGVMTVGAYNKSHVKCALEDFGAFDETVFLSAGEKIIFNKLAALEKKIDALIEELHPQSRFDKKKFVPKGL